MIAVKSHSVHEARASRFIHCISISQITLTIIHVHRVAPGARFRQSVDRNSFRSPCW